MKSLRLMVVLLLACVLVPALVVGCGGKNEKKLRIGISIPSADHGWTGGVVSWAEQAKKDIEQANPDVEVIVNSAGDSTEQVKNVENLLVRNIDVLVILPHEPESLTAVCKKAKKQGVKLIVVDRGLTKDVQDLNVVGNNHGFGEACAKAIAEELGGAGDIVVMEGVPCQTNTDRVDGFNAVMKGYPDIHILQSSTANWSQTEGQKLMDNMLKKFSRIDAVWAGDDDVLLGALNAYRKSGRSDVKLMVGGGGSKTVVKMVLDRDPLVRLTVTYPPKMIYAAALEGVKMLRGKGAEGRIVVPADTVRADNAKDFYYPDSRY